MHDKKNATCCFTGHRVIRSDYSAIVAARTEIYIRELILEHGVRFFGVGGALGFDTLAANILFRLRDTEFPQIRVILVYPFEGYTSRWSTAQQAIYEQMLQKYDKRVCVAQNGSREAYLARNRHLVDSSAFCICFLMHSTGGTAYTVKYAKHKGLNVINILSEETTRNG